MSLLKNGKPLDDWLADQNKSGEYIRKDSQFRNWITADGSAGVSGESGFKAEAGRYHLYVSYACPWANRTLIFRKLKQLEDIISVSVVHPDMEADGWKFDEYPGATIDHINEFELMRDVYILANPDYSGVITVPVLWDKKQATIVNNESSEIIRMMNTAFNHLTGNADDYYPEELRDKIDVINDLVYDKVNNGVYRAGFATTQVAYEKAFDALFETLDQLEDQLSKHRYLVGDRITEADWRLFVTLVRFDAVYVGHFKCNLRRMDDYPNLSNYLRELYQCPGVASTINMDHIKRHYYFSHESINPTRIVPKGPKLDFSLPHNRQQFKREGVS